MIIIAGLPGSRTAWFAQRYGLPHELINHNFSGTYLEAIRAAGGDCTTCLPQLLEYQYGALVEADAIVWIDRPAHQCVASFERRFPDIANALESTVGLYRSALSDQEFIKDTLAELRVPVFKIPYERIDDSLGFFDFLLGKPVNDSMKKYFHTQETMSTYSHLMWENLQRK